eukprot:TRINITY_DN5118_c0_g1_i5.p2 TRINITY_DN5118_c0_g1~~TRINITY_DN5118_c0_g1_i5.p2  ORF type:complete len:168 (+),score=3.88 TRINITY_DN5118_c0_g1_i5:186-689(+)
MVFVGGFCKWLVILLVLLCSGYVNSAIIGRDDRVIIDDNDVFPFNTIGKLTIDCPDKGEMVCTGTLINPVMILTAAQCVSNDPYCLINFSQTFAGQFLSSTFLEPVTRVFYPSNATDILTTVGVDVAILQLDTKRFSSLSFKSVGFNSGISLSTQRQGESLLDSTFS